MKKDTKILVMAVVIILVALISFNLSDLTGMVGKSDITTLTVSPTKITFEKYDAAKMITIRVLPSDKGVDKKIQMYKCNTLKCDYPRQVNSETANICTNSICDSDVTIGYRVDSGLYSGWYFFKAKREIENNKIETYISNKFEITHEVKNE